MRSEIRTFLLDIQKAIEEIESFLPEQTNFTSFKNDLKTKRAIERNIEIIGEAVKRIHNVDPNFPLSKSRNIIDTRNRIIHGYDKVSDAIIWSIIVSDIPLLSKEVNKLLVN